VDGTSQMLRGPSGVALQTSQHSNNTNEFLQAPYLGNRPVLYALRALSSLRKTK
jgi:hypothetical protein